MSCSFIIHPEAEEDIRQAYRWYEESRAGLGEDFVLCVEAAFGFIQENPLRYPAIHEEARRALVRRFPYGVFYAVARDAVVVLAVLHCSRDAQVWRSRLAD